jgi:hypothetical protein
MRLILLVLILCGIADNAAARPIYRNWFQKRFALKDVGSGSASCYICHAGKSKRNRNTFGKAIEAQLERKNEKNLAAFIAALDRAVLETDPVSEQTFLKVIQKDWARLADIDDVLKRRKEAADAAARQEDDRRKAEIARRLAGLAEKIEQRPLGEFEFLRLDGTKLSSSAFAGKVTVLHFWNYHGNPDAPYGDVGFLMHWYERRPTDVDLIGIAVDARLAEVAKRVDVTRDVSRFRHEWKLPYKVVLDTENALSRLGDPQRVGASLPLTLVVAADGTIVNYRAGASRSPYLPELRQAVATARRK